MNKKYYVGIAIIVVLLAGLVYGIYWNVKDVKETELKNSIYYNTYYYTEFSFENNMCLGIKFYEDGTSYLSVFDSRFNEVRDNPFYSKTEGTWSFKNNKEILLKTNNTENTLKIVSKDKLNWEDGFGYFSILGDKKV